MRIFHRERAINEGSVLIVSNHESFLDPPFISVAFDRPIHFLARKTLFENRWFGALIRGLNSIPVDQERPDFTSLKRIIALLKKGERVLIFPEGQRTSDGQLGEAQPGVGLVIAKSRAPILPVRIFGAYKSYPRGAKFPRPHKVSIVVGEPLDLTSQIDSGEKGKELYQKLGNQAMAAVAALELPKEP